MATLQTHETGLGYPVWIGKVGGHHGPRIKVSNHPAKWRQNDNFVMSIDQDPAILAGISKIDAKDLNNIKDWISINFDDLMLLWWMFERDAAEVIDDETNETISFDDIIDRLKRI